MRVLSLHIRTSGLSWVALAMCVLAGVLLLSGPRDWVAIWPEAGVAALTPAFVLSVLAAGAAAWASSAPRRHRTQEQTAAMTRSDRVREGVRFAVAQILLLAPYVLVAAATFVVSTATTNAPGQRLWLGYVAMGGIAMVLATTWGWLVGRYLSPVFSALVALLTWFLFVAYAGNQAALIATSGPPWRTPDATAMLLRALAAALFVAVAVTTPVRFTVAPPRPRQLLMTVAASAVVILAGIGPQGVAARPPSSNPVCTSSRIEVCLWPEHAKYLPMVNDMAVRAEGLPDGVVLPARLYEYGLESTDTPYGAQQSGDVDISEGRKSALAVGLASSITSTTFARCDWKAMAKKKVFAPDAVRRWIELYLSETNAPDYVAFSVPEGIQAAWVVAGDVYSTWPASVQRAWVTSEIARVRSAYCA